MNVCFKNCYVIGWWWEFPCYWIIRAFIFLNVTFLYYNTAWKNWKLNPQRKAGWCREIVWEPKTQDISTAIGTRNLFESDQASLWFTTCLATMPEFITNLIKLAPEKVSPWHKTRLSIFLEGVTKKSWIITTIKCRKYYYIKYWENIEELSSIELIVLSSPNDDRKEKEEKEGSSWERRF